MEDIKKIVLVPWDFTEGCEIALQHAVQLAQAGENEIMLLTIIPQFGILRRLLKIGTKLSEIEAINKRFDTVVASVIEKYGIKPQALVLEGNPKKILKNMIVTANVNLIITYHTYRYNNKDYRASDIMKNLIFKDITLPFIVINKPPLHDHYIEIAIPVYHDRKFKEAVHWIIRLAKYYKCNVNFIKPYLTDDYRKKQLASNIYFTKKMLDGVDIVYGIKTAKKTGAFEDEVFRFAETIEADLILLMTDKYKQMVNSKREKELNIPVMCVNTRIRKYQSFN